MSNGEQGRAFGLSQAFMMAGGVGCTLGMAVGVVMETNAAVTAVAVGVITLVLALILVGVTRCRPSLAGRAVVIVVGGLLGLLGLGAVLVAGVIALKAATQA